MVNRYSEEEAVQKPAGELLKQKLHWDDVIFCFDNEVLGLDGTLGRESERDVLLKRDLEYALIELNEHLELQECQQAIKVLESTLATDSLLQINEKKYEMLRNGIPVEHVNLDGTKETVRAQVFDFENPANNRFVAAEELWVQGPLYRRRCDLVGFVNGVPLLFVEFKRHDKDVIRAYEDNYTDYQDTVPQVFFYNAFVMLSNGIESKVGTLGSSFEFFHEWKRLRESDPGEIDLATMLLGICKKENLLDLFENFILFDHSASPTAKILARNHQYLGVNEAVQWYVERKQREGKLGVFWHTQGSGKSYSMVFFARKVRRIFEGSPTFVVVTDRDELDKQIAETFEGCGCLSTGADKYIASSGDDLVEKLKGNPSFIFTLIQKFNRTDLVPIVPADGHDIVIMSDEAHRTNNGLFAENMCRLLPAASRLGFTGTPLLAYDNLTKRTFGGYVSTYDFRRAIEDGATVPLFYENRSDKLDIQNPVMDDELADAIERAELDPDQAEKVERDIQRQLHIITATPRLEAIAQDFVEHYTGIWESGKAMFVAVDKVTAVRMYELVQKRWKEKIDQLESECRKLPQQEALELRRKIGWMRDTEMAVVISQEQNEVSQFQKWGIDIASYRQKMIDRKLDDEFKDRDNPLRVVFVCAMWLTGFDVKPLGTMYFDKPLKAHTLMQAIARANRVSEGKSNGLIVDYIGVVKALREALADYTANPGGSQTDPVVDKEVLIARIEELTTALDAFLGEQGFDLKTLVYASGFGKIAAIKAGANAVSCSDEVKKRFGIMARELFKMFKFVARKEVSQSANVKHDAINAIYNEAMKRRDVADTGDIMVELQRIVDDHIVVERSDEAEKMGTRFDIGGIDFDRLRQEFSKTREKNLLVDDLRTVIESRLDAALRINPRRADFFKRYENIIADYNAEQDKATIEKTFNDLMRLASDLDEAQRSYIADGFTSPQQQTIFEMLFKETLTPKEIKRVKAVAVELVDTIETRLAEMVHWTDKEETQATVQNIIRDELYRLPEEDYPDDVIEDTRKQIYDYFYTRDRAA
ncbi:MAG: type I restriction endonuclease subunit R [Eggerthellaceae bacterium]|jgi:type I restriction enzyme R subunit|nr:type I restriction endonuclease subunit R [Eggerthellaceae bacterium]